MNDETSRMYSTIAGRLVYGDEGYILDRLLKLKLWQTVWNVDD